MSAQQALRISGGWRIVTCRRCALCDPSNSACAGLDEGRCSSGIDGQVWLAVSFRLLSLDEMAQVPPSLAHIKRAAPFNEFGFAICRKQDDNSSAAAAIGGALWLAIKACGQPAMFRTQVDKHLTSTTQDDGASPSDRPSRFTRHHRHFQQAFAGR